MPHPSFLPIQVLPETEAGYAANAEYFRALWLKHLKLAEYYCNYYSFHQGMRENFHEHNTESESETK
jgi:hypothetical protein